MVDNVARAFGDFVKAHRLDRGLTQQELSDIAGTTKTHVCRLENGQREPSLGLALRLCEALGADINEFAYPAAQIILEEAEDPTL